MINTLKNIFFFVLDSNLRLVDSSNAFSQSYSIDSCLNLIIDSDSDKVISLRDKASIPNYFYVSKEKIESEIYICLIHIDKILHKSSMCSLTNLPNRNSLIDYLKKTDKDSSIFICLLNLDDFSSINDVYGGIVGDNILKDVSLFLSNTFTNFKVYRLRDDEFALISNKIEDYNKEVSLIEKVINSYFNSSFMINNHEVRLGSTGAFALDKPGIVLKHANETLKYAKLNKKNFLKYNKYLTESKSKKEYCLNIINKIKYCISNNSVIPYYQPIVDNKSGEIYKYEALMRLNYKNEILLPYDFMELALKSKTYNILTSLIIEKIFADVNAYGISVSINITMDDINNIKTTNKIYNLLCSCKYPENITFELIETVEICNIDNFHQFLANIKSYRSKISIDDFGTGYSNFEYFSMFDFDYLKIDGSFIKDIVHNKKHQNIVKSLLLLIKDTPIKLIGEFVENKEILDKLNELGVHFSQGYYFDKALPIENLNLYKKDYIAC